MCPVCCSDRFGALAPSRDTEMPRSGRRSHKTPVPHDAPALRMCRRGPRHGAQPRHVLNANAIQKMLCEKTFGPRAAAEARTVDAQPQRRTHRRCGRGGGGAGRAGRRTDAGPRAARRAAECCRNGNGCKPKPNRDKITKMWPMWPKNDTLNAWSRGARTPRRGGRPRASVPTRARAVQGTEPGACCAVATLAPRTRTRNQESKWILDCLYNLFFSTLPSFRAGNPHPGEMN